MATEAPPADAANHTIYVNNLNEKVAIENLKKELQMVFAQFGEIKDIIAMKGKLPNGHFRKGQAWVVFGEISAATNAMKQMQGFPFHEKPMRIQFANKKSDAISKDDGTFVKREKKRAAPVVAPAPVAEPAAPAMPGAPPPIAPPPGPAAVTEQPAKPKRAKASNNAIPHHILFCEGLPDDCTTEMLALLFQQYHGYKEVRLIGVKHVAFVEFLDIPSATVAKTHLDGFKLKPETPMAVSFAKQ